MEQPSEQEPHQYIYAGLFLGGLEGEALQEWSDLDPDTEPEDWWRFLDDILFWW